MLLLLFYGNNIPNSSKNSALYYYTFTNFEFQHLEKLMTLIVSTFNFL